MKTTLKIGKSNGYGSKPGSRAVLLIEVLAKGSKLESIMPVQDINIHSQALLNVKDSNKIDALKEIGCIDTEPGIIGRSRSWLWLYRCKLTENLKAEVLEADDHVNVVLESNKPESAALNLHIIYPGIFQMEVLLRSEPGAPLTMNQQVIIGVAVSILATPSELIKCRLHVVMVTSGVREVGAVHQGGRYLLVLVGLMSVVTMAEFLRLPDFRGCKVAVGTHFSAGTARLTHTTLPPAAKAAAADVPGNVEKDARKKHVGEEGTSRKKKRKTRQETPPTDLKSEHVSSPTHLNHSKPLEALANEADISENFFAAWLDALRNHTDE
ncbi:hypothetical protein Tco_0949798 [Tanacetum coccineum]